MGRKRKEQVSAEDAADGAATRSAETAEPKKKRGKKASKEPVEKRVNQAGNTVRYSKAPSQTTRDRIQRALPGSGHRLFLLERKTVAPIGSEGGPIEEFAVLGTSANVYEVRVGRFPSCTCPDAAIRGNLCKHYLYVMIRVLRLKDDDPLVWQRALLTSEAEEVLNGSRSTRTEEGVLASAAVRMAYKRMCGSSNEEATVEAAAPVSGRPVEGDCPICYDDLIPGGTDLKTRVVTCHTCGNHVHEQCFKAWAAQKRSSHQPVTCVYCRSDWADPAVADADGRDGKYINLKGASAEHNAANPSLYDLYGENARWIGRRR